jgi:hypothetical protein
MFNDPIESFTGQANSKQNGRNGQSGREDSSFLSKFVQHLREVGFPPDGDIPIPYAVTERTNLSAGAKLLFGLLARQWISNRSASIEELARLMGKSASSVERYRRELLIAGLINRKAVSR